jgi:hypothetical protein
MPANGGSQKCDSEGGAECSLQEVTIETQRHREFKGRSMSASGRSSQESLRDAPIAFLGLGHVWLSTGVGLAESGRTVFGADDDPSKVALI